MVMQSSADTTPCIQGIEGLKQATVFQNKIGVCFIQPVCSLWFVVVIEGKLRKWNLKAAFTDFPTLSSHKKINTWYIHDDTLLPMQAYLIQRGWAHNILAEWH